MNAFDEPVKERFERLLYEWEEDTKYLSSTTEMSMHPAYQQIIGMGKEVLLLILEDLRKNQNEPRHWFWALSSITG